MEINIRKDRMTKYERLLAILNRQPTDRVPAWGFAMGFTTLHCGLSIADAYNNPKVSLAAQRKACQDFGWVFTPMTGGSGTIGYEFGGEMKWPSGEYAQAPMMTRTPVQNEDDAWKLKLPDDVATAGFIPIMTEFYKLSTGERLDNQPFNAGIYINGPFTRAGKVCDTSLLCKWLVKKPDLAHHVLRLATDYTLKVLEYWKDTLGIEGTVIFGSDPSTANQLLSPRQFEEFAMPYQIEVHKKITALGWQTVFQHVCGEQNENLPYWAKIPMGNPGIISIGHEVELAKAAEYFPNDIIMGNLEPAIIQTGTPEEIYQAAKKVIEDGKKIPGGFIFAPGCELPPRAPAENVMATTRAVNDFGWYD